MWKISINSTILFVVASTLAMTIHELGHFIASFLVHASKISIHHNYTSNAGDGLSLTKTIIIKAAGPLVSLAIGSLFHFICAHQKKRNTLFLFYLYMAAFGYIGFFGYLLIAPLIPEGDTGFVCYAIGFPIWLTTILALAGAAALYFLMVNLMKYFVEMGSKQIIEDKNTRAQFIRSLLLYPLLMGIIVTTLLNLPIPALISLIAPICSPLTFLWAYGTALNKKYSMVNANRTFDTLNKLNPLLFVLLILTIAMNRLMVNGIYI